jgi:hypothetical protein
MYFYCTHVTEHKCQYGKRGEECTYCAPADCPFARMGVDPLEKRVAELEQVVKELKTLAETLAIASMASMDATVRINKRVRALEVDAQIHEWYTEYRRPSED